MSVMTGDRAPEDRAPEGRPETRDEFFARKRGGNLAIFACIMAFFLLFFIITILKMS